jgi:hypothetical protein
MAHSIWSGQSIYWNPYSATGMYGPETLVDVKTSPLSVLTALLGGSDIAFHIALLGLSFLGIFCLLVLLAVKLRLCLLAAIAGGVSYVLNGYNVPHPGANFTQTWLYFPVLALALVSFARKPQITSFIGITCGATLILSTTFLPTTFIVLATTMVIGAAAALGFAGVTGRPGIAMGLLAARLVLGQGAGVLLALALLGAFYLPIFEAMHYMGTGELYGQRTFFPATFFNFISLFTPKHAFEQYNAITAQASELRGNIAFHQGIVGALLALQAIRSWSSFRRPLVLATGVLLVLMIGRAYGWPVITQVVNSVPVLGNFGEQYIWIGIGELFTIAVALGVHAAVKGGVRILPSLGGALLILTALSYTTMVLGIEGEFARFYIAIAVVFVVVTMLLLVSLRYSAVKAIPCVLLVLLSWCELTFYVNHYKLSRTDRFTYPPNFVRFLQINAGLDRVASYGHYGIPPEYGSAYGLYQIGSMNFNIFPNYLDLFNRLLEPDPEDRWATFATFSLARDKDAINLAALSMLGVKYLIAANSYNRLQSFMDKSGWKRAYEDQYFTIFENPQEPPRAFIVHRLMTVKLTPVDFGLSPLEVALSDDVKLEDEARRVGIPEQGESLALPAESAAIFRYDHTKVKIAANLVRPGILVLNDAWHPNWSVKVDGAPHYLGRVDEAFRGLVLPSGQHIVEMTYAPRSLYAGRAMTFTSIILMLAMYAARRRLDPLLLKMIIGSPANLPSTCIEKA